MGTNFYLHEKPDCECCKRPFERLHIGKSSWDWRFSLHVMPEDGIASLDDWRIRWSKPGAVIRNEYGETVAPQDMEANITQRSHPSGTLLSHDIGPYCIGHGDGPFDYMIGEFS